MPSFVSINTDSFSSGQIGSKLWLCETLETTLGPYNPNIWILGGWYGLTAFMLLTRNIIDVNAIRSFDIDPSCEPVADTLLNNWVWQEWKFKAFTADCNILNYQSNQYGILPSLVINTSCEHFHTLDWYNNIPQGTTVALQSNNMPHDDHFANIDSLEGMKNTYPMQKILFSGEKIFEYPSWSFTRYMIIGVK